MSKVIVCPACQSRDTRVVDTREVQIARLPWPYYQGHGSMRRHRCLECEFRWSTHELSIAALSALAAALKGNPPTEPPLNDEIGLHIGETND